ncbi:hypothetical protein Bca52824_053339 [Brassica carinata]|uniref:Uncharacterized protein n=1 Tax=Brassica carinata TaxID=52824 RepID=A0A8X7UKT9_BRACI|nr:hypothetical protein Bca52824_053339 [Brassica carinata]
MDSWLFMNEDTELYILVIYGTRVRKIRKILAVECTLLISLKHLQRARIVDVVNTVNGLPDLMGFTSEEMLKTHMNQFGLDLLPVLAQIHGSSVNGKCLSVIGKLIALQK